MPVLVIVGEHDRSTPPPESVALWQALSNARLCILPDVHMLRTWRNRAYSIPFWQNS